MNKDNLQDELICKVHINHEEQCSNWPTSREIALGWRDVGKQNTNTESLACRKEVWTHVRPLSLKQQISQDG